MERMHVTVEDVHPARQRGMLLGRIRVESRERVGQIPRAILRIRILVEDPGPDASRQKRKRLARIEALRFLDIS